MAAFLIASAILTYIYKSWTSFRLSTGVFVRGPLVYDSGSTDADRALVVYDYYGLDTVMRRRSLGCSRPHLLLMEGQDRYLQVSYLPALSDAGGLMG